MNTFKILIAYLLLLTISACGSDPVFTAYETALDSIDQHREDYELAINNYLTEDIKHLHGVRLPNFTFKGKLIPTDSIIKPIVLINDRNSQFTAYIQALDKVYRAHFKNKVIIIINTALTSNYAQKQLVEYVKDPDQFRRSYDDDYVPPGKKVYSIYKMNPKFNVLFSDDMDDAPDEYRKNDPVYINDFLTPRGMMSVMYINRDKKIYKAWTEPMFLSVYSNCGAFDQDPKTANDCAIEFYEKLIKQDIEGLLNYK